MCSRSPHKGFTVLYVIIHLISHLLLIHLVTASFWKTIFATDVTSRWMLQFWWVRNGTQVRAERRERRRGPVSCENTSDARSCTGLVFGPLLHVWHGSWTPKLLKVSIKCYLRGLGQKRLTTVLTSIFHLEISHMTHLRYISPHSFDKLYEVVNHSLEEIGHFVEAMFIYHFKIVFN